MTPLTPTSRICLAIPRRVALVAALTLAGIGSAAAQPAYPSKPVKLVVPYAPGGSVDIVARLLSEEWAKALGTTMYIENKGGAGGNIGVD